jgi:hypothetical protein
VFVTPSAGGPATQVSHEATGAFTPTWSADGADILYVVLAGPAIRRIRPPDGTATIFAPDDAGVSDPICRGAICLAVTGALDADGDLIALSPSGRTRRPILVRAADDRQPAILVP